MAEIIARWEWRSFGQRFGGAEDQLERLEPGGVHDSDEIYLLSASGRNVKIRDGLIDIKELIDVNADGLQQWTPVMKASVPLEEHEAHKVLESLHLTNTVEVRSVASREEFLAHYAGPNGPVRVVYVHKRRARYQIDGCMAELTDVVANGEHTRSLAVEATDPAAVIRVVRELGLGGYTNTSYPDGLAALLDGEPERYAVIDLGTNSVKFHIGERDVDGQWQTIADRADMSRIGEGLAEHGRIGDAPLERTIVAIAGMVDEAKWHDVRAIAAVGTAALRIAGNAREVVDTIQARTGVRVEVISGEEESRFAYLATIASLGAQESSLVVFETGGGSSQFTFGRGADVDERFSVDVGVVRYTERFQLDRAVSPEVLTEAMAAISSDLARIDGRPSPAVLVGMGGTVTNITAVMHRLTTYDPAVVHGSVIDRAEIERQAELYRSQDSEDRRSIVGLQPNRADVILAGVCIVRAIMEKLGMERFTVSDRGLRHGLLVERFGA